MKTKKPRCLAILTILTMLLPAVLPVYVGAETADILPTIEEPVVVKEWLFVGPFSSGAREGLVDPLIEHGGVDKIKPVEGLEHHSCMAENGVVKWTKIVDEDEEDEKISFKISGVNWEALQDHHGWAGLFSFGFAYAEYVSDRDARVLIRAEEVGGFRINGTPYRGNPYGRRQDKNLLVPVVLKKGVNRILITIGGMGDEWDFTFKILPAEAPVMVNTVDMLVPDIILGEKTDSWAAVPLVNTTGKNVEALLRIGDGDLVEVSETGVKMPPRTIQKVPIKFTQKKVVEEKPEEGVVKIPVKVTALGEEHSGEVDVRVREKGESFRITFRSSIDESIQKYSVLPPKDYTPGKSYGLILSLHGASVDSDGVINVYSPKDWAFVVAPTNRERFGFDWQDWGRLDTLEVLEDVVKRFNIDVDRVYLTGHSMGGHGTWHIGLHHADKFAAIAPSAGWTSFYLYTPFFLRKSYIYAPPKLLSIWEAAMRPDKVPLYAENALNLPIYILQGRDDEEVPPFHPRLMTTILGKLGYDFVYEEVPEKKHWWDLEGVEGTACMNYPEMMEYMKHKKRETKPKRVVFRMVDPSINNSLYWVRVDEQDRLYEDTFVDAELVEGGLRVKAENAKQITFLLDGLVKHGRINIWVNNQKLSLDYRGGEVTIHQDDKGKYLLGPIVREKAENGLWKTPNLFGPIKAVYFKPFILVYGASGSEEETELNLHLARLKAQEWWWRANGWARIIPDTEVTNDIIKKYNLVLYGGPKTNRITKKIIDQLPIRVEGEKVVIGDKEVRGRGIAVKMVYPNPLNPNRLVLVNMGTDIEGMRLTGAFTSLYSGSGLPDYLVYDKGIRMKSWGGIIAAGFFGKDWSLEKGVTYIRSGVYTKLPEKKSIWEIIKEFLLP